MAKKKETQKGEQMDLIEDVQPKNAGAILKEARIYKKFQAERLSALAKEKEHKQKVLDLVKAANLQPLEDGIIRFRCDGVLITVKPRDELITVKDEAEEE
jgi:hypothetical protein